MKTIVYTSDKNTHFFKELREIFKQTRSSNFLAYQMAKRDLQAQYRQSFLGFFWAFAPIITNSLVWIFLNGSGTVSVNADSAIPYILFVVIGTTLWSIFTESILIPLNSVNASKSLLSKINFPKEALILSGIYKMLFNLILKMLMVGVFLIMYGITPGGEALYFPFLVLVLMVFSVAVGLLITPIGLLYTDIARIVSTAIPFLMYFTPVVFAVPQQGFFKNIFELNPLTYLIGDARNALVGNSVNHLDFVLGLFIVSVLVLLTGLVIFRKSMPIIIEKISG